MEVKSSLLNLSDFKKCSLAIGFFDGFHLGHQEIIRQTVITARRNKIPSVILTFSTHPKEIFDPSHKFSFLTTPEEKIQLLQLSSADLVIMLPFTKEFSQITAEEFIKKILVEKLAVQNVTVGENFTFGQEGKGTSDYLQKAGEKYSFDVNIIKPVKVGRTVISSTLIRQYITDGEVEKAANALGRPYYITGEVIAGYGYGRKIGFPTANLTVQDQKVIPKYGVYHVWVTLPKTNLTLRGAAYLGTRPTFKGKEFCFEIHLLGFSGELYQKNLDAYFISRIRPEKKFSSTETLIQQIKEDINSIRNSKQFGQPYLRDKRREKWTAGKPEIARRIN